VRRHELLVRAFPRAWRELYGSQVLGLLAEEPDRRWQGLDLVRAGLAERQRHVVLRVARRRSNWPASARRARRLTIAGSLALPLILAAVVGVSLVADHGTSGGSGARRVAEIHGIPEGTSVRGVAVTPVGISPGKAAARPSVVRLRSGRLMRVAVVGEVRVGTAGVQSSAARGRDDVDVDGHRLSRVPAGRAMGHPAFHVVGVVGVSAMS
jgi:hypothetical protein